MSSTAAHSYSARAIKLFEQEPQIAEYEMRSLERGAAFDELYFQSIGRSCKFALDVGCGSGRLTLALAERAQFTIGLDLSPTMLALAQERAGAQANVRWVLDSADTLPFRAMSFDLIVSSSALRLTETPRALREIERVLKPRGHVAIRDVLRAPPSRVPQPLREARWTIMQAAKLARYFGLRVSWNAMRYHFSSAPNKHHARENSLTKTQVEQEYARIFPGCTITWGTRHYFVAWVKPAKSD